MISSPSLPHGTGGSASGDFAKSPGRGLRRAVISLMVVGVIAGAYFNLDRIFCGGDSPAQADAIIVLAGGRYTVDRVKEGLRLLHAGYATNGIVSGVEFDPHDPNYVPATEDLLRAENVMVDGKSRITRGSSLLIRRLAAEQHWQRVIVVTSAFHWRRTRALFRYDSPAQLEIRVCTIPDIDFRGWWKNPYHSRILRSEFLFFISFYLWHTPYGVVVAGLLAIISFVARNSCPTGRG